MRQQMLGSWGNPEQEGGMTQARRDHAPMKFTGAGYRRQTTGYNSRYVTGRQAELSEGSLCLLTKTLNLILIIEKLWISVCAYHR